MRSLSEWFDAFMDVQWPVVLMLVLFISLISCGLFSLLYWQIKFFQKRILEGMKEMSDRAETQREGLQSSISGNVDKVVKKIESREAQREADERENSDAG